MSPSKICMCGSSACPVSLYQAVSTHLGYLHVIKPLLSLTRTEDLRKWTLFSGFSSEISGKKGWILHIIPSYVSVGLRHKMFWQIHVVNCRSHFLIGSPNQRRMSEILNGETKIRSEPLCIPLAAFPEHIMGVAWVTKSMGCPGKANPSWTQLLLGSRLPFR